MARVSPNSCISPFSPKETPFNSAKDLVPILLKLTDAELSDVLFEVTKVRPQLLQILEKGTNSYGQGQESHALVHPSFLKKKEKEEKEEQAEEVVAASEICQIQFCSALAYGLEEDSSVKVNVMRLGKLDRVSIVPWHTFDGSAKAGKNYKQSTGLIEFGPDETYKTIEIGLIDNSDWDPTLDFFVLLDAQGVQNATIHRSHVRCRVKILDDDAFPTNKFEYEFQDKLSGTTVKDVRSAVNQVSTGRLMIEYFKVNIKNKVVRRGSIKCFATDFLRNIKFIFKLTLNVILVNKIFMPVLEDGEEFTDARHVALVFVAAGFLAPDFFLHGLAYRRNYWKVAGASRKLLQRNLVRSYMSYSGNTRSHFGVGGVMLTLFGEVPELVADGYCNIFPLVRNMIQLILLLLFQLLSGPLGLGKKADLKIIIINLVAFTIFPIVMIPALMSRERKISHLALTWKTNEGKGRAFLHDMLHNFYLISDFQRRDIAAANFEKVVDAINGSAAHYGAGLTNTLFISTAVSVVVTSGWVLCGGLLLMKSDTLDLGSFLASIAAFRQMGKSWSRIYETLLRMQTTFTQLRNVTAMLNLPSDESDLGRFERQCEERTQSRLKVLGQKLGQPARNELAIDKIPIEFQNVSHNFEGAKIFDSLSLTLAQGKLHAISTYRSAGKSSILHLVGRRILPCLSGHEENFFLPVHLKIRHVTREPMFVIGTLYENLVYGVHPGDKDMRLERVLAICRRLQVEEETLKKIYVEHDDNPPCWRHVLSASTQHLLHLARGFIANADMLVIHRPFGELGPNTKPAIRSALRDMVDYRGLETDPNLFHHRRPRTCIISVRPDEDVSFADECHFINRNQSLQVGSTFTPESGPDRVEREEDVMALARTNSGETHPEPNLRPSKDLEEPPHPPEMLPSQVLPPEAPPGTLDMPRISELMIGA